MKQFAIIGCGEIAETHAENIMRIGNLRAVCDIEISKAERFSSKFKAKSYSNIDDLLALEKEVDAVIVCTPNGYHAEHIIKSLQAGKDVVTESPLCLTKAAAWQIIETEKYCRRKLLVVKPARYIPQLAALKEELQRQEHGKLHSFNFRCTLNVRNNIDTSWKGMLFPGGGALYSFFSSYIDIINWLFGEVANARGFTATSNSKNGLEVEDMGSVSLLMQNGILGSFMWSLPANDASITELTISTEKGTIKLVGENLLELERIETTSSTALPPLSISESASIKKVYDHFQRVTDDHRANFPDAFEGLKLVETIEMIYKATS
jgi:UDP-N-acetyl-2-amino-2-deoxyglucuronate dehydrogenase